jgi:hypothetical protein
MGLQQLAKVFASLGYNEMTSKTCWFVLEYANCQIFCSQVHPTHTLPKGKSSHLDIKEVMIIIDNLFSD